MIAAEASSLIARARERFAVRDYHGTVLLVEEAVQIGGAYADAFNMLGLSLALIDRTDDALASFESALRLNPRYVEAHLNRAIVLANSGRAEDANEGFRVARELGGPDASGFPFVVGNRLANAHASLGHEYREAGALDESIAQYRRALELRPAYADIRVALARALLERGHLDVAIRELDSILVARPTMLDAILLRGLASYLAGDMTAAALAWDNAAARHPAEPRVEIYRSMLGRRLAVSS